MLYSYFETEQRREHSGNFGDMRLSKSCIIIVFVIAVFLLQKLSLIAIIITIIFIIISAVINIVTNYFYHFIQWLTKNAFSTRKTQETNI